MVSNKEVKELLAIYKKSEQCAEKNNYTNFCVCLKKNLMRDALKNINPEMTLLNYKMRAKSYVEADFVNFNICGATLLFAIFGIIINNTNLIQGKCESKIMGIMLFICIIFVTVKSIKQHQKNIKLREILFVLEADNIDLREVQCNKEVFVKEYIIDRKIAENFFNICKKEKITETEQLNKMMEQFVKEKRK